MAKKRICITINDIRPRIYSIAIKIVALMAMLSLGCVGPKISITVNEQADRTIYRLSGIRAHITQKNAGYYANATFDIEKRVSKKTGETHYLLPLSCLIEKGILIGEDDKLTFEFDQESIDLNCIWISPDRQDVKMGSTKFVTGRYYVLEAALFRLDRESLLRIVDNNILTMIILQKLRIMNVW